MCLRVGRWEGYMDIEGIKAVLDAERAKSPSFAKLELLTGMAIATTQGAVAYEVRAESDTRWAVLMVTWQSGEGIRVRHFGGTREVEFW